MEELIDEVTVVLKVDVCVVLTAALNPQYKGGGRRRNLQSKNRAQTRAPDNAQEALCIHAWHHRLFVRVLLATTQEVSTP